MKQAKKGIKIMINIYDYTEAKVKQFVMEMLDIAAQSSNPYTVKDMESQAYGAIQFSANYSFPSYNYELVNWWDEVKPEFRELL